MSHHISSPVVLTFQASGKFMLFGEYLVLQGSECLAIPLKFGQSLKVEDTEQKYFTWNSISLGKIWFTVDFDENLQLISSNDEATAKTLLNLLQCIKQDKPHLFYETKQFTAIADFDLKWGLGSSSTLISLLAQWSETNPYRLLDNSFGGSGYDIACATAGSPICYNMQQHAHRPVRLSPAISNKLLFVYSGQKQNSKSEVKRFANLSFSTNEVQKMNQLIHSVILSNDVESFETAMDESEQMLTKILQIPTIKSTLFQDYPYTVKSMGAWGGDFFMASFREENEAKNYFRNKGFDIQFSYSEISKV
jgi:mevalonate kinase